MANDTIMLFIDRLQKLVAENPDEIILVDDPQRVTRKEFMLRAYRINAKIQRQGVKRQFLPIVLPNGVDYLAAETAIWMSGNAAVNLLDSYPAGRIAFVREHCEAPFVIDQAFVDDAYRGEPSDKMIGRTPGQDCVMFYTSGSTGNPKGVLHSDKGFMEAFLRMAALPEIGGEEVYANIAPFSFVAITAVYVRMMVGAVVHLIGRAVLSDIGRFRRYLQENEILSIFLPPALVPALDLNGLKLKYIGVSADRVCNLASTEEHLFINGYGQTETAGGCISYYIDGPCENTPVGRPMQGLVPLIVDEDDKEVPQGEEGELCFRGITPCKYYKDPERTAALMKGGIFHTGDIFRRLPSGDYLFVNRKDWMVKINGQRVEPGEVESAMRNIAGVKGAVVKGFKGPGNSMYLCAYYVGDGRLDGDGIRAELEKTLPEYMIPAFFVPLERFPLNDNGKIDRKSLRAPDLPSLQEEYAAPENETERMLCEAYAAVLNMEKVGVDADFIRLGGDSIRLMGVQKACSRLPLSTKIIYKYRTPRRIAAYFRDMQKAEERRKDMQDYPLSMTQLGIYMACRKQEGVAVYNNPYLLAFNKGMDAGKLAAAVVKTMAAHASLRTRIFIDEEGEVRQKLVETPAVEPVTRCSEADFAKRKADLVRPFFLLKEPLFRYEVIETEEKVYLFLDFHHIVFDGTSYGIFFEDLDAAYRGGEVAAETYTHLDLAADEADMRATEALDQAKAWYAGEFRQMDAEGSLPGDLHGDAYSYAREEAVLDLTLQEAERRCEQSGSSLNVLSNAAFALLTGRLNRRNEALYSTIYNGRDSLKTERTMGMLVKTLPVHAAWGKDTPVKDYLQGIKDQMLGAMNHDIYSFAEACSDLGVNSSLLFACQTTVSKGVSLGGEFPENETIQYNSTGEQLTVSLLVHDDGALKLRVEYDAAHYSRRYVLQFMDCYRQVLAGLLDERQVAAVQLLDEEQKQALKRMGRGRELVYDKTETLVSILRRQARAVPDHTFLVFKDRQYTYKEADALTDRLAARLIRLGLENEQAVGVMIERSELMFLYSMAVMKAGGAYMPLDGHFPEERLMFMCRDADVRIILTADGLAKKILPGFEGTVIDDFFGGRDAEVGPVEWPAVKPSDRMVILYTSGSTGKPKGVELEQRGMVNLCHWYVDEYGMTARDRTFAYANYGFDAHMLDLYPTMLAGASVHILPEEIRLDLVRMHDYIVSNKLTVGFITTAVGCQLVNLFDNPTLRVLSSGGEKMPPVDAPDFALYNVYGPTECSAFSTFYRVKGHFEGDLIGGPLANYQLYVIDDVGNLLPDGIPGELLIAGVGVARGYLNRPELTAEKFITFEGERAYRSGDLVRWTTDPRDGSRQIEFLGRLDKQVKLRGLRIELGEIENRVAGFEGISQVCVDVKEMGGSQDLVCYYTAREGASIDEASLRAWIADALAAFMVPSYYVKMDRLPLSPNGKVDRKKLPPPAVGGETPSNPDTRALNVLEKQLSDMVEQLVGHAPDLSVPLQAAGLSSILAMRLSVMLFKKFGIDMKGADLLAGTTLLDVENKVLERLLDPARPAPAPSGDRPAAGSATVEKVSPVTFAQKGVYFDCLKNPEATTYNVPCIYRFGKGTPADTLVAAVKTVCRAHPSLRSRFEMSGEKVVQVVEDDAEIPFEIATTGEEELPTFKENFLRPFDLSKAPLCRFAVVTTPEATVLFTDFHHLVFDGTSMSIFMRQLGEVLRGEELEPERLGYTQYAIEQEAFTKRAEYDENRRFFGEMLGEFEQSTRIPADRKGDETAGKRGSVSARLDFDKVSAYAQGHHVTPAGVMLAAAFYAVARFTNNDHVYLATISNGRGDVRLSDTVGMFINTLPLGIRMERQTKEEFIRRSGEVLAGAVGHEVYPFAQIAADYGFKPDIVFAYQMGVLAKNDMPGLERVEGLDNDRAKFLVEISIEDADGTPAVVINYNDALYGGALMRTLAECVATIAVNMTRETDAPVRTVSMMSPGLQAVVDGYHQTCLDERAVRFKLFHQSVEHWAETRPDATAVIASDGTLTYRRFNEKANVVAHRLIALGVVPGDRICLLLPRNSWHLLAMFGVMKAGAAYIPCDPEYPAGRIKLITEDSHARYIVTTKDKLADYPGRALDVEELLAADAPVANPGIGQRADSLAYLIYTSGSTGRPKGVMLRHEGICNYLTPHPENRHFHALVKDCRTMLSITTVSFDLSLKEIGASLYNGMTLVFADENQVNDPQALADLMLATGVDAFSATPSRLKLFLDLPDFRKALAKCRFVVLGGEKYPPTLLPQVKRLAPAARLFNTYGPTEISVSCNGKELTNDTEITIGRPLLNVVEYVVDKDLNELSALVTGELLIGGLGVAAGYNDLPDKTKESFITYKGDRCYRSGDYAYWNDRGEVVVLGRKDHQIKLNGLRIELGEVETVLNRQPQVKEGVVMIRNVEGHDHLVAYYTVDQPVSAGQLKEQMGKSLARYMVPSLFVEMEKMPISPNGKTDLKALPLPKMAEREYAAPANDAERFFAETFSKILGVDKVGATDDFFELGGTSLVAIRVVMAAMQAGYRIVYKQLFSHPTPRKLALLARAHPEDGRADAEVQNYDYARIDELLAKNDLASLGAGPARRLGVCLVTGATGFLGVHLVKELVGSEDVDAVYCMVRGGKDQTAEQRLTSLLYYYFEDTFEQLFGKRLFVVEWDVTKSFSDNELLARIRPDTVFNCAANVKHFSAGTDIEDINVGGCRNCMDYCLQKGARLIQTSTHSIAGVKESDHPCEPDFLDERRIYWGQRLDNAYARAKFLAERNVLEAIVEKGLDAKIMRLGNLSARSTDGEFQINFRTNAFMGRLRAYRTIGCISYRMVQQSIEFSPINEVARAVVLLSRTPGACTVFHPVNAQRQLFDNVIVCLNKLGIKIDLVDDDAFRRALAAAAKDPVKAPVLQSLMAYQEDTDKYVVPNGDHYAYTTEALLRLGFRWNFTSWDYMERFIVALQGLGLFDEA